MLVSWAAVINSSDDDDFMTILIQIPNSRGDKWKSSSLTQETTNKKRNLNIRRRTIPLPPPPATSTHSPIAAPPPPATCLSVAASPWPAAPPLTLAALSVELPLPPYQWFKWWCGQEICNKSKDCILRGSKLSLLHSTNGIKKIWLRIDGWLRNWYTWGSRWGC